VTELRGHRVGVTEPVVQHRLLDDQDEVAARLVDDAGPLDTGACCLRTVVDREVIRASSDTEHGRRVPLGL
jgi:hypothetical protein